MNQQTASRLEKLYPALQSWAAFLSSNTEGLVNSDDLLHEMVIHVANRIAKDPARLEMDDDYLVKDAAYNLGRTLIRSEQRSAAHIADFEIADDLDDDEQSTLIIIADDGYTPEEHVIRLEAYNRILDLFQLMTAKNRKIARMLAAGYTVTEIAADMGVTKSCIVQHKNTIAELLSRLDN